MIPEIFKTRFYPNGLLRKRLILSRRLLRESPGSEFAKNIYSAFQRKFYGGSTKHSYASIQYSAWLQFIFNQTGDTLKIDTLYFKNDLALISEYSEIFLSDTFQKFEAFKGDALIAAKILTYLSNDGPYQTNDVFIKEGDVVIDAGANMGVFSMFAKDKAQKVYAFEPQQRAIDILSQNIRMNRGDDKISIVPFGLAERRKTVDFYYNPEQGHVSGSTLETT